MNFQTMASELTALPFSNASLLDEATAAAEAMAMCWAITRRKKGGFFVAADCHPQTIAVVQTRAKPLGIEVHVGDPSQIDFDSMDLFGALVQYPTTDGRIENYADLAAKAPRFRRADGRGDGPLGPHSAQATWRVWSRHRSGLESAFWCPHWGSVVPMRPLCRRLQEYERFIPGRVVGLSKDDEGGHAFRLARQTREQHIRREKATSNICTAQVLLAVMASMYAIYHGPEGLRKIALKVRGLTDLLAKGLRRLEFDIGDGTYFDTLKVRLAPGEDLEIITAARSRCINLRQYEDGSVGISLDQTVTRSDIEDLLLVFSKGHEIPFGMEDLLAEVDVEPSQRFARTSSFLEQRGFSPLSCRTRDVAVYPAPARKGSLARLLDDPTRIVHNEAQRIFRDVFPSAGPSLPTSTPLPRSSRTQGYSALFEQLESWLGEITGLTAVSLQPNAGSQGELTGLLVIRALPRSQR